MKLIIRDIFDAIVSLGLVHVPKNPPRSLVSILLRAVFGSTLFVTISILLLLVAISVMMAILQSMFNWSPNASTTYYLNTWFYHMVWVGCLMYLVMFQVGTVLLETLAKRRLF